MGMPLPDLPERSNKRNWRHALVYLRTNGPSTAEQIAGEPGKLARNMSAILNLNPDLFVRVGERKRNNGKQGNNPVVWSLRDGA